MCLNTVLPSLDEVVRVALITRTLVNRWSSYWLLRTRTPDRPHCFRQHVRYNQTGGSARHTRSELQDREMVFFGIVLLSTAIARTLNRTATITLAIKTPNQGGKEQGGDAQIEWIMVEPRVR